jgi:RNA 3'-terminal phosphate cyclase
MIADRTRPAERTARGAANELFAWLDTGAAVSGPLADQLLLPLSLANGPSDFTTSRVTEHLLRVVDVIRRFLPVRISIEGETGGTGKIRIEPTEAP